MRSRLSRRLPAAPVYLVFAASLGVQAVGEELPASPSAPGPGQDATATEGLQHRALDNGSELVVIVDSSAASVAINVVIRGGISANPPRQAGLAALTAGLLTQGTRTRTAPELAADVARLGAGLAASAEPDFTRVAMDVPARSLDAGLEILADVVMRPALPADGLAAAVAAARRVIEENRLSPHFQASRAFTREVYGNHPYGRTETVESLSRIDVQDVVRHHRDLFRPNNALFVVVGRVDPDSVQRMLESYFRGWTRAHLRLPTYHGLPENPQRRVVMVHVPGATKAVVRAGHPVPHLAGPEWAALLAVRRILGADDEARLARALGAGVAEPRSTLTRRRDVGAVQVMLEAPAEAVPEALTAMLSEVESVRVRPPSALELERTKTELLAATSVPTDVRIRAARTADRLLLEREGEDAEAERAAIAALTPEDVRRAAWEHLRPGAMVLVVAGDAHRLLEALRPFGPVTLRDATGLVDGLDDLQRLAARPPLAAERLGERSWDYRVEAQDWPVGEVTRRLIRETPGTWRLESDARIGPRAVRRSVTFRTDPLEPLASEDLLEVEGRRFSSRLAVADGRVTGVLRGARGERDVDAPAVPGALLGEMVEVALWMADLTDGEERSLPVIGQDGAVTRVRVRVLGERTVAVPAGTWETWETEVEGAGLHQRIFVTRTAPRFTVKIELVGQPVVTLLTRVLEGTP